MPYSGAPKSWVFGDAWKRPCGSGTSGALALEGGSVGFCDGHVMLS